MLLILQPGTPESSIEAITSRLRLSGLSVHRTEYQGRTRLGAVGDESGVDWADVARWDGGSSCGP